MVDSHFITVLVIKCYLCGYLYVCVCVCGPDLLWTHQDAGIHARVWCLIGLVRLYIVIFIFCAQEHTWLLAN